MHYNELKHSYLSLVDVSQGQIGGSLSGLLSGGIEAHLTNAVFRIVDNAQHEIPGIPSLPFQSLTVYPYLKTLNPEMVNNSFSTIETYFKLPIGNLPEVIDMWFDTLELRGVLLSSNFKKMMGGANLYSIVFELPLMLVTNPLIEFKDESYDVEKIKGAFYNTLKAYCKYEIAVSDNHFHDEIYTLLQSLGIQGYKEEEPEEEVDEYDVSPPKEQIDPFEGEDMFTENKYIGRIL